MTEENNNNDIAEVISLIVKSINQLNSNIEAIGKNIESMDSHLTFQLQKTNDALHKIDKTISNSTVVLSDIAESNRNIAEAFYYVDGQSGSVYHMAGSLNGIKHAIGHKPNPNKVFGHMKKSKDHAVLNQKVEIGQQPK